MVYRIELGTDFSRGMIDDVAATAYPRNCAASIINGRIQPDGTCRRKPGSHRLHPTALNSGATSYGLIEYTTAGGTTQLINIVGTKFFYSVDGGVNWTDGTGANTLTSGYYTFATMEVAGVIWLFAANGNTSLWRWNGATLTATPNAPAGVPYIAVHNARLWAAGHAIGRAAASKIDDPTVWATPDGLYVTVKTHDGSIITGLFQIGPHLLVFGEDATAYIDGFGEQTLIVAAGATGFSRSVGCIAFRTITGIGENGACWLSKRGIEYYTPGAGIRLVSRGIQKFLQTYNRTAIADNPGIPCGVYDSVSSEYWCALPGLGATTNNKIAVINLLQQGTGWAGAASIDEIQGAGSGTSLFFKDTDGDGYLEVDATGVGLTTGVGGYAELADPGEGIVPTVDGGAGYLNSSLTESIAASLCIAADADRGSAVHSAGYDGFVRKHTDWGDLEDILSTGAGGLDVELEIVGRPDLFGDPHNDKRVRTVHVQTIQDVESTVTVAVRAGGQETDEHNITMPATSFNQPQHGHARVKVDGGQPQPVIRTTDDVRVAVVGLTAKPLRGKL